MWSTTRGTGSDWSRNVYVKAVAYHPLSYAANLTTTRHPPVLFWNLRYPIREGINSLSPATTSLSSICWPTLIWTRSRAITPNWRIHLQQLLGYRFNDLRRIHTTATQPSWISGFYPSNAHIVKVRSTHTCYSGFKPHGNNTCVTSTSQGHGS